ncbi:amino acid ABC transporter permease [Diaphorobacter ruginosibacter]|jgi:polar amino acid transport system permease protein|uniref:Amino acid ABC transporter permease n=1 Tax=Diaphorobacter ruginosibacter TaxID=1715720 RepID=A0A7G9RU48_9BURK|nr:amino acid ABC transporter permease [Diaphorobacter ruginosibacter]MDR2335481.1 amino acid ABC transporter permease [Burkholderiaceae bacterium]QNN59123.1 amino acid ABC transporter permease [Diaphorobacter ruginosibacter]
MSIQMDFSLFAKPEFLTQVGKGLINTLELAAIAFALAMTVAVVIAVMRMSANKLCVWTATAYVEYHQNVPLLVHIFLWYFGVAAILPEAAQQWINAHNSEFIFAFIGIGLCLGAYMSEDLRGGIRSIPASQLEASRALGLSYLQAARLVIMPQALRIALPPLINHTVLLFKNTSLAMTVGVAELTYVTKEVESATFKTFEVYLASTVIYLVLSLLLMWAGALIEHRTKIKTR